MDDWDKIARDLLFNAHTDITDDEKLHAGIVEALKQAYQLGWENRADLDSDPRDRD